VFSALKQALFPDEFVVDEAPLAVFTVVSGDENHEQTDPAPGSIEEMFNSPRREDLLSQMEAILLEQVRLAEKARRLEMNNNGNDEFGRFIRQALPFLDNFARLLDMAREQPPSEELNNWLQSVESLYYRIIHLLESYGLRFINSLGKVVDLDYHEVIDYRTTNQFPHNTIIKEVQKGVVFRDRLLRDAKVVVARNESHPDH
jgi:molecular chaperone GrpE (heat shock protein)